MKKVLVTGAGGLLGRYVVDGLIDSYELVGLDKNPCGADIPQVEADIMSLKDMKRAIRGVDAVVHIAAAAHIGSGTPDKIMAVNVLGTWNLLEAAWGAGVQRVILCSSDSVMGNTVWPDYFRKPDYLPVDERHQVHPADPYGLSKLLAEEAGRSFAARGEMEVLALRPVFILFPSMMGEVKARQASPASYNGPCAGGHVGAGGGLCWHHIDPRDVASAFRCSLEYSYQGFESFYLSAASTLRPEPTLDRLESFFGSLPDKVDLGGWYGANPFAPLFDTRRAQERLGWKPMYDHREEVTANHTS